MHAPIVQRMIVSILSAYALAIHTAFAQATSIAFSVRPMVGQLDKWRAWWGGIAASGCTELFPK
ncbi:MAG: hypothetical protein RMJ82_14065, partial [Gemmatales bacterium]|nr:hypothetical protein [Gemmatales bacterium]